jgi:hypothetical protein
VKVHRPVHRDPAAEHPAFHPVELNHSVLVNQPPLGVVGSQSEVGQGNLRSLKGDDRFDHGGSRLGFRPGVVHGYPDRSGGNEVDPDLGADEWDLSAFRTVCRQPIRREAKLNGLEVRAELPTDDRASPPGISRSHLESRSVLVGVRVEPAVECIDNHFGPPGLGHRQPASHTDQNGYRAIPGGPEGDSGRCVSILTDSIGDPRLIKFDPTGLESPAQHRSYREVGRDTLDPYPDGRGWRRGLVQDQACHAG